MARYKLKDLSLTNLEYGSGAATIPYDGKTRYVRITDIDDQGKLSSDFVSPSSIDDKYILNDGDILFARTGATVGKSFRYHTSDGRCLYAGFLIRVVPNQLLVRPDYLWFFTKSPKYKTFVQNSMKVVAQPNINAKQYGDLELYVPSLNEQDSIISIFSTIKATIELRQQQLQALDDLVKARFVEMFGDPIVNPKGYPIVPISDLFDVGSSKRVFESEWRSEGVPFYRAREIVKLSKDGFVDNDLFIEEGLYEKYKAKYGVPKAGDMMVTGVGTLGICYIVQPNDRFYFKDGNTLWFKNKGLCNVRFIMEQYNTDFVRGQIEANANVSTVGTYTITNANNTMILLPSIEEQNEFDSFVSQVDKSKVVVQKALDEAQVLFDSLMQQYFG